MSQHVGLRLHLLVLRCGRRHVSCLFHILSVMFAAANACASAASLLFWAAVAGYGIRGGRHKGAIKSTPQASPPGTPCKRAHPSTHTSHTHPSTHTFASHCPRPIDGPALVLGTSARCRVSGWGLRVWCGGVAAVARGASQVLPWWAKTTAALATRPPVCGQERPRCRSVGVEVANRVRCHLTLYSKG